MIPMDAQAEYMRVREEHGLPPHDWTSAVDLAMLDYFICGVVTGVKHTLLAIREKQVNG